jgi:hypothetical protein
VGKRPVKIQQLQALLVFDADLCDIQGFHATALDDAIKSILDSLIL